MLTKHQKRVIAALLKLEQTHGWNWWTRDSIGHVVDAGGFHQVIQMNTVAKLKEHGLIQTERSSWPPEIAERINCSCACHCWGLTAAGRELAGSLRVNWGEETEKRLDWVKYEARILHRRFPDEDEPPDLGFDDEDGGGDDGDSPNEPRPVCPGSAV